MQNGNHLHVTLTLLATDSSRAPSIFVQLFWTAMVGPWILWKIRNVNDVHSWAWQTRLAIFAGYVMALFLILRELTVDLVYPALLCGSPSLREISPGCGPSISSFLQRAGKSTPSTDKASFRSIVAFAIIFMCVRESTSQGAITAPVITNTFCFCHGAGRLCDGSLILSDRFLPSLIVCQQVLILIPLRDAARNRTTQRRSLSMSTDTESLTSIPSNVSEKFPGSILTKDLKPKASMQALEANIEHNIDSLVEFTASREFTAENTVFLREVRNFKRKWSALRTVTTAQRRQMHTEASLIFFTLINPFIAETPINIEYKIFKKLQEQFEGMEYDPYMPTNRSASPVGDNVVCPWENTLDRPTSMESNASGASISSTSSTRSLVPSQFTEEVFDPAFESIKYLVFTNTWPRYVDAEMSNPSRSP